jgi:hypothetical protein
VSSSYPEQLLYPTSAGNYSTVVITPGTSPIDLEQPGDCELEMSRIVAEPELNALHHLMPTIENESDWNEFPFQVDRSKIEPGRKVFETSMMGYEKRFDGRKIRLTRRMEYEKGFDGRKLPHTIMKEYEKGFDGSEVPYTRMMKYDKRYDKGFDGIVPQSGMLKYDKRIDGTIVPQTLMMKYDKKYDKGKGVDKEFNSEPLRSATDLKKAGLRIEAIPGMMRQVAFKNSCLSLPILQLHDRTESYFRNLAMYEVFDHYDDDRHAFADYLHLMSDLIKTPEDVAYLIDDCKVIRNELVTHQNAFEMWERLQSGLLLPKYSEDYRKRIVDSVNIQCESTLNVMRTEFYDTFCSKPWLAISVITAAVLLLATLIQTYVSVIGSNKMEPHFPRGG